MRAFLLVDERPDAESAGCRACARRSSAATRELELLLSAPGARGRRAAPAPRHDLRRAGRRQEPARRASCSWRLDGARGPRRPLPLVRRRRHLLAARRDPEDVSPDSLDDDTAERSRSQRIEALAAELRPRSPVRGGRRARVHGRPRHRATRRSRGSQPSSASRRAAPHLAHAALGRSPSASRSSS